MLGQLFLEPDGVRHLLLKNKALRGHTVRVRPDDQARIGQLAPWEQGARILLALRSDFVVAQNIFRRDVVAGLDIFQQRNQLIDLCLRKRIPEAAFRRVLVAGVDDLDADRADIQLCISLPVTHTRVIGLARFVDQHVKLRLVRVCQQIMAADHLFRQDLDRAGQVADRVMDDDEFHAWALAARRQAVVEVRRGRATGGEQGHQQGEGDFFHERSMFGLIK